MYSSGFFDGGELYGQTEFNRYFDNIYNSGVSVGDDDLLTCKVTLDGNNVIIGAGFAIIKGFWFYNSDPITIALGSAPSSNSRIERVVLRLDVNGSITPTIIKGTAAATPKAPALTRNEATYDISLARIKRTSTKNTLTDERADESVCGTIRPKNVSAYKTMVEQMQTQFSEFMNGLAGESWRNIYNQVSEPTGAARGSIWIQEES